MWDSSASIYQPQQSVLKRHAGHRQTACILNISAPHRSQMTLSAPGSGRFAGWRLSASGSGFPGSGMGAIIADGSTPPRMGL